MVGVGVGSHFLPKIYPLDGASHQPLFERLCRKAHCPVSSHSLLFCVAHYTCSALETPCCTWYYLVLFVILTPTTKKGSSGGMMIVHRVKPIYLQIFSREGLGGGVYGAPTHQVSVWRLRKLGANPMPGIYSLSSVVARVRRASSLSAIW